MSDKVYISEPKPFLTRDELLALEDVQTVEVTMPEWGNKRVLLKALSAIDRDTLDMELMRRRTDKGIDVAGIRCFTLSLCILDPATRKPMFGPKDVEALNRKSDTAISRLVATLEKLSKDADDRLKKDFAPEDGGASPSTSPASSVTPSAT